MIPGSNFQEGDLNGWNFPVFVIIFPVMFIDIAHNPAWVSDGNDVGGDIFCYDASGTNYGIISDRDSGHDDGSGADPAVPADMDGHVVLIDLLAEFREDGMAGGGNGYIRPNHGIVAYINVGVVHAC